MAKALQRSGKAHGISVLETSLHSWLLFSDILCIVANTCHLPEDPCPAGSAHWTTARLAKPCYLAPYTRIPPSWLAHLLLLVHPHLPQELIVELVEQYGARFDDITYCDTFKALKMKYEQLLERGAEDGAPAGPGASAAGPGANGAAVGEGAGAGPASAAGGRIGSMHRWVPVRRPTVVL